MSTLTADQPHIAPAPIDLDRMEALKLELDSRLQSQDPVAWAQARLGDTLWSAQRRILESVRDHRKTAAPTCHEIGKSFSAAIAAAWWLDTHPLGEAFVVTTAPTNPQVRVILWKEIGRAHTRGRLAGRVNQTEWIITVQGKEETVAMGRKPNDYSPTAFQGIHAPYVLVIVDEANGVRGSLWDALDSLMANDNSKILAIGNPDDPSGEFFEHCKPASGWNVVSVGAFDSPNFTGEPMPESVTRQLIGRTYVEERRAKWAPSWVWTADGTKVVPPAGAKPEDTHPFWQSKVLGRFPVQSSAGSLIPLTWIRLAQERNLQPDGANELGLDVGASKDGDPSCLGHRRGPVFRVLWEQREPDTMATTGRLVQALRDRALGAALAKVDYIGVGRGVVDRCREQELPVHPIQVGEASTILACPACKAEWDAFATEKPRCPKCNALGAKPIFANLLAQLWWQVRERFETGDIDLDPNDEDLAAELLTVTWRPNSKGQTVVEYGDGPSPNRADALLMAFAPAREQPEPEGFASW